MSLHLDDAGPILFTMDSHSPSQSPSMSTSPTKAPKQLQPQHSPPPLPQRNARRASRFLDALLDAAPTTATTTVTATAATSTTVKDKSSPKMTSSTHEVYLSSEEDASSLGDVSDYEDAEEYDYDSDTVECIAPVAVHIPASMPAPLTDDAARRHSHEDKARLVSVVYAGKPSLVDLAVERAARRRSLSARSNRSDSSASRPSTSAGSAAGSAPSTALSSANASPQRLQHKRNSSGSMLASLRYRKAMETIADSPTAPAAKREDMPKPMRSYTTTSRAPPLNTAIIAAAAAANAANGNAALSSSPRTPTFASSNLLRGVTRSLTLSRRGSRLLNKDRDAAVAAPQVPLSATAPALPGQLPGVPASDVSSLRRKSLALSVVSLGLGSDKPDKPEKSAPPGPQTPDEHMFTTSIAPALRRASTTGAFLSSAPAHRVLSKKNTASSPSTATSFFGRRRSVKLL